MLHTWTEIRLYPIQSVPGIRGRHMATLFKILEITIWHHTLEQRWDWIQLDFTRNLKVSWEGAHSGLRNEPPLDMSGLTPRLSFMASLWIRSGEWLAIKGNGRVSPDISSGGSFWSSQQARSQGTLKIDWEVFFHFDFPCRTVCDTGTKNNHGSNNRSCDFTWMTE